VSFGGGTVGGGRTKDDTLAAFETTESFFNTNYSYHTIDKFVIARALLLLCPPEARSPVPFTLKK
jgi:hypothetical protein